MMENRSSNWKVHLIYVIIFIILGAITLNHSYNYHKKRDGEIWKGENYADQGGYFIYGPVWFTYGYQSANFPLKTDSLLGNGFDLSAPVIKNKYTCGVAYLQTPFYLWSKLDAKINHRDTALNSKQIKRSIDFAAVFYMLMGAILLYFFLVGFFKPFISFISIILVVIGSNVFYYGVYHPGMSHIYSFFLFSAALLLADSYFQKRKIWMMITLSLCIALIILIRPTNILFIPAILFIRGTLKQNLLLFLKPLNIFILLVASLLVFGPQMYYWYKLTGKFIYYSYSEEGFTHLRNPAIIRVLFAPENGLIPYSFIFIILFAANIYAIIKKQPFAIYYLIYQIIALYLIASWHAPAFGASYGQRNFVEIYTGLIFIFAFVIQRLLDSKQKILLIIISVVSVVCCLANLKIMSRYEVAFFGRTEWDWREYKYFLSFDQMTQKQNFDTYYKPEFIIQQGKNKVLHISANRDYTRTIYFERTEMPEYFKRADFSMKIQAIEKNVDFEYCLEVANNDSTLIMDMIHVQCDGLEGQKWKEVKGTFLIRKLTVYDLTDAKLNFFIWNRQHYVFNVDDAKVVIQ